MDAILERVKAFAGPAEICTSSAPPCTRAEVNATTGFVDPGGLTVICFSKDRPYQLHQFLSSVQTYLTGEFDIIVIYKKTTSDELYHIVFDMNPKVKVIRESEFEADICTVVAGGQTMEHVMFCVDDMLFVDSISVDSITRALRADRSAFGLQVKLHAGIVYSHAASKPCFPPPLTLSIKGSAKTPSVLSFLRSSGSVDWCYPFDLCGGVYRRCDVLSLLSHCKGRITNPNVLEVQGNQTFVSSGLAGKYPRSLCLDRVLLRIVTINRVQETYEVPIFPVACPEHTLEGLNRLVVRRMHMPMLDCEKYRCAAFASAHIGEVWLRDPSPLLPQAPLGCMVTVLIPVWNGSDFIEECVASLLETDQGCPFRVLVVNDGSTDRTAAVVQSLIPAAAAKGVVMELMHLPTHVGLVTALDAGLRHCSTPFIARLDADDVCLAGRLRSQLEFMKANSQILVLGGQAILRSGADCGSTTRMMTMPALALHSMLTHCPLLHPTVMLRRDAVLAVGGYGGGNEADRDGSRFVEDYSLWARIAQR